METDDNEWELSKENVQPLRRGRQLSALNTALNSEHHCQGEEQNVIKSQQSKFEMELRTYDGDDPLDVWDRYIKWTEQYFPKGGHLMKLFEQCLKAFQKEPIYSNDHRFIEIWIKFAGLTEDPVEVFSYMFDIGIGSHVSSMYVNWAQALETSGDLKRANAIYQEGLNRHAEPMDTLKQMQAEFQDRVAQNLTYQARESRQSTWLPPEGETESRMALSRLKAEGKRGKIGVTRTGTARTGNAGILRDGRSEPPKQKPSSGFQIFSDCESQPSSLQPQQTNEWQSMPIKAVSNRENDQKPGQWTSARAKQRPGSVSSSSQQTPFEIHQDPSSATPQSSAKTTTMLNHQPLSAIKAKNPDVLGSIRQPNFKPNTGTPMYQKDKIYNGLMEFSFEELRAERYWKRRKEREIEEENREMKARIAALEAALLQSQIEGGGPSVINVVGAGQENNSSLAGAQSSYQGINNSGIITGPAVNSTGSNPQPQLSSSFSNHKDASKLSTSSTSRELVTNISATTTCSSQTLESIGTSLALSTSATTTCSSQTPESINIGTSLALSTSKELSQSLQSSVVSASNGPTPEGFNISKMSSNSGEINCNLRFCSSGSSAEPTPVHFNHGLGPQTSSNSKNLSQNLVGNTSVGLTPENVNVIGTFTQSTSKDLHLSGIANSAGPTPESFNLGRTSQASSSSKELSQSRTVSTTSSSRRPTPRKSYMGRGPLQAPSPTVFTKEAYDDVLCMFNGSLTETDSFMAPTTNYTPSKPMEGVEDNPVNTGLGAFDIYMDTGDVDVPAAPPSKGFFIHEDTSDVSAVPMHKGLEMDTEVANAPNVPASKGFFIREDTACVSNVATQPIPEGYGSDLKRAALVSHTKEDEQCRNYTIQVKDESCSSKPGVTKASACRNLEYMSNTCDQEMMHDLSHAPDFTIVYGAKYDHTIASLDSFSHQARAASTPYNKGVVSMVNGRKIEEQKDIGQSATAASATSNWTDSHASETSSSTPSKDLSPIPEGSNEGSNDDLKSMHSTAISSSNVTLRSHHGSSRSQFADLAPWSENDGNVSMKEEFGEPEDDGVAEDCADLDKTGHPKIDTTAYIPAEDEEMNPIAEASICIDPKDPFDNATIAKFLATLSPPLEENPNFVACEEDIPDPSEGFRLVQNIVFEKKIGQGGYASIWTGTILNFNETLDFSAVGGFPPSEKALKIQALESGQWEFYITTTLQDRLSQLSKPVDVRPTVLDIEKGFFFNNGSALQMEYMSKGSLLDLVNLYRSEEHFGKSIEPFACLLTIELLWMFEKIHACHIIHGDVKPDNFLLMNLPTIASCSDPGKVFSSQLRIVKLIDFGQSIDMTMFPDGTTFTAKVVTSGFQCIEMQTNRPWTYQTDLFGLAATIHVVLFGSYMKVSQQSGTWRTTGNFNRKWNCPLWKNFFNTMLNIPSCQELPDLAALRVEFEKHFMENLVKNFNTWVQSVNFKLKIDKLNRL